MKNMILISFISILPFISNADGGIKNCYPGRCGCNQLIEQMDQLKGKISKIQQEEQSVQNLDAIISNYQELKEIQNISITSGCE